MNKEFISVKQGISIIIIFIMGSSLVLPTGAEAKNDLWIAIILGFVMAVPFITIYARVISLFPNKDFFDIVELLFGKIGGKFIALLYIWFALYLGSLVLRNFGEYLSAVGIPSTPMIVTMSILALLCIWVTKEGIEVLGRLCLLAVRFLVILVILTVVLLTTEWDFDNVLPIFYNGYKPVLIGAMNVFSFPFTEIVVFMMISSLDGVKNIYKTFWFGLAIGGLVVFLTSVNELMTLGYELYQQSYFPSHIAVSRLDIGNLLQRLEILPAVALLTGGFVKISTCLLAASKGLSRVFEYDHYRFIVTPLGILMVNLAYLVYNNIMDMVSWAKDYWPIYAFPFQVILPLIIWIAAEFKARRLKTRE